MNDLPTLANGTDITAEQVIAHDRYDRLRDRLVTLQSAPVANDIAINACIEALATAQTAYQATHGLVGNHARKDPFRGVGPIVK